MKWLLCFLFVFSLGLTAQAGPLRHRIALCQCGINCECVNCPQDCNPWSTSYVKVAPLPMPAAAPEVQKKGIARSQMIPGQLYSPQDDGSYLPFSGSSCSGGSCSGGSCSGGSCSGGSTSRGIFGFRR